MFWLLFLFFLFLKLSPITVRMADDKDEAVVVVYPIYSKHVCRSAGAPASRCCSHSFLVSNSNGWPSGLNVFPPVTIFLSTRKNSQVNGCWLKMLMAGSMSMSLSLRLLGSGSFNANFHFVVDKRGVSHMFIIYSLDDIVYIRNDMIDNDCHMLGTLTLSWLPPLSFNAFLFTLFSIFFLRSLLYINIQIRSRNETMFIQAGLLPRSLHCARPVYVRQELKKKVMNHWRVN